MSNPLEVTHGASGMGRLLPFRNTTAATEQTASVSQPEATIMHIVNAQIPTLPDPLKLLQGQGPLLATVETWSDGSVVARLPIAGLYADGESDTEALESLAMEIRSWAAVMKEETSSGEILGAPLDFHWRSLTAMVDVSGL